MPNDFEVMRKDLFSLEFPVSMGISEKFLVSAQRPKVNNAQKEVAFKNLVTYYKGKTKVDPISIEFRDAIGASVYQKLFQWQREHTDFNSGKGGYAATYKKTITLNMEDPTGAVVQKFILKGCFIVDLNGGDLNMDSDDIAQVAMTISVDSFDLEY